MNTNEKYSGQNKNILSDLDVNSQISAPYYMQQPAEINSRGFDMRGNENNDVMRRIDV